MKKKGFIKFTKDVLSVRQLIGIFKIYGVSEHDIVMTGDFASLLDTCKEGDSIVVRSLSDVNSGILSILKLLAQASEKGVVIESVEETWLKMDSETCNFNEFITGLADYGARSVSNKTRIALIKARESGTRLGRPIGISAAQMKKYQAGYVLYSTSNMTVANICKVTGMEPRSFYRYLTITGLKTSRRRKGDNEEK